MAIPFYDRVTPRCGMCLKRKHVDNFRKWYEGRFIQRPFCCACEPSNRVSVSGLEKSPAPIPQELEPLPPYLRRKMWDATFRALHGAQSWCARTALRTSPAWEEFIDAFWEALDSAVQRAENMREWGNDPQSADYFFSPERLRLLKGLYEAADPQGEHPYGKPACLSWFYRKGLE